MAIIEKKLFSRKECNQINPLRLDHEKVSNKLILREAIKMNVKINSSLNISKLLLSLYHILNILIIVMITTPLKHQ